jgi:metal-dependent amidase/aminoacylase/carboxypeptidase family protein
VITVGTIRGGDRRNVIPDRVDITGTVRALSSDLLTEMVPRHMRAVFDGVTAAMDASYDLEYYPLIVPVMNDPALVGGARSAVAEVMGPQAVATGLEKAMTSEDFACFAERVPGLYMKIGCTPRGGDGGAPVLPLHFRGFRFDESAIRHGVLAMAAAVCGRLAAS